MTTTEKVCRFIIICFWMGLFILMAIPSKAKPLEDLKSIAVQQSKTFKLNTTKLLPINGYIVGPQGMIFTKVVYNFKSIDLGYKWERPYVNYKYHFITVSFKF